MREARELVSAEALRRYDDNGDPVYSPIERILLALRWFDWASKERILEAIELDAAELPEREKYTTALSRLVARGRVERRGESQLWFEYRLAAKQPAQRDLIEKPYRPGRNERLMLGLCLRCDNAPEPGRQQCVAHLALQTEANRRRRPARSAA